jgi:hypothetical protein
MSGRKGCISNEEAAAARRYERRKVERVLWRSRTGFPSFGVILAFWGFAVLARQRASLSIVLRGVADEIQTLPLTAL